MHIGSQVTDRRGVITQGRICRRIAYIIALCITADADVTRVISTGTDIRTDASDHFTIQPIELLLMLGYQQVTVKRAVIQLTIGQQRIGPVISDIVRRILLYGIIAEEHRQLRLALFIPLLDEL